MKEIVERDEKTTREVWPRKKQLIILKKLVKFIKLKLLKVFQKKKRFQFIFMENGMISAEDHIYLQQVKLKIF